MGYKMGAWSGDRDCICPESFPVTAGSTRSAGVITKDDSVDGGLDTAFIDNVTFRVAAEPADWFAVSLQGDHTVLKVETRTPAGGPGEFVNRSIQKSNCMTAPARR